MKKIYLPIFCLLMGIIPSTQAQTCNSNLVATTPTVRFTVNRDNTVTDNATGLIWMRCSLGQSGRDCHVGTAQTYTWAGALNEVANNHSGWRLPNIKELASIVELRCKRPAINMEVFPKTERANYWSSSPSGNEYGKNLSLLVNFSQGNVSSNAKSDNYYVRLVRN